MSTLDTQSLGTLADKGRALGIVMTPRLAMLRQAHDLGRRFASGDTPEAEAEFRRLFPAFDSDAHQEFIHGVAFQAVTTHGDPVPPYLNPLSATTAHA